jgi:diguanylate cyclase (GGDEF)-like protein
VDDSEPPRYARYVQHLRRVLLDDLACKDKAVLVLGAGGFTLSHREPSNRYTYVDIDPKIREIAETRFLKAPIRGEFIVDDARRYVRATAERYDAVVVDVFSSHTSIPGHLVTREFWQDARRALAPEGVLLANLILDGKLETPYARNLLATIESVFGRCGVDVLHRGKPLSNVAENWCVMPVSGEKRYLAVDAGPIYDDHGKLVAVVETLRDITDQKLAEMALQNLATVDSLTGLANRRSLDEKLQHEWKCGQRNATPLAFILADVDHFKLYNDHYGHQKGDECLRLVAGAIAATVFRPADLTARYGGEEFAIIMPNTDLAGATAVAERICTAVRDLAIRHAASETSPRVSLSLGVAVRLPNAGNTPEMLIQAADSALYRAKSAGRNRVVAAEN